VSERFDEAELDVARSRIEALLERLAEGRFEVTDRPHRALCLDCPARERLCSHQQSAQLRDSPDPPIEPIPRGSAEPREGDSAEAGDSDPQLSLLGGE
jgi:hypothetical protein